MATIEKPIPAIIGQDQPRIEGPLKVSGGAIYASDNHLLRMAYAVPVCSTIASGIITKLDIADAEQMPGVLAIYHHGNIGTLYRPGPDIDFSAHVDELRPPFEDETIRYSGQYVALVTAKTFEQAQAAAAVVRVTYREDKPNVAPHLESTEQPSVKSSRGEAEKAFAGAPVRVDQTYSTPVETHNPIELHATLAVWQGKKLTLYETTQAVVNHRNVMAQILGIPPEDIQVISRFLGSGFGGKLWPWPHCALAAAAARQLARPVKLVVSRKMMFTNVGHRPRTQQQVRISASAEGKLVSLQQDYLTHTSLLDDYEEDCGEATAHLYSVPNLKVTAGLVRRNVGTPTAMRGPGAVPGLFAIESAMDELAIQLKMDPVELRLRNEPAKDEGKNLPFSSRHLKECLTTGAQKFGWSKRTPTVGSMRNSDGLIIGWGVAACTWIAARFPCEAMVDLRKDGTARVSCGTQDIGTGTYTVLAQVVSAKTGIPMNRIEVVLGDTSLPPGPISGGSMVTGSVIPAVSAAAETAIGKIVAAASKLEGSPFSRQKPDAITMTEGRVHLKDKTPDTGVPFQDVLTQARMSASTGIGKSEGTFGNAKPEYSTNSYGAHFVEVTWQPEIVRLRVTRVVSVIDAGRMLNPRAARNQIEGAVVMGVGMALFEHTTYDPRNGAPVNSNLADYIVATNADSPEIDVTFLDHPDFVINDFGARGVGEIGLAGMAAAITGAVYHATGVRVRELPVRIEDLLV